MGKKPAKCFKKNPFTPHERSSRPTPHTSSNRPHAQDASEIGRGRTTGRITCEFGRERPGELHLGGTFAQNAGSLPPKQGFSSATNSHSETCQSSWRCWPCSRRAQNGRGSFSPEHCVCFSVLPFCRRGHSVRGVNRRALFWGERFVCSCVHLYTPDHDLTTHRVKTTALFQGETAGRCRFHR